MREFKVSNLKNNKTIVSYIMEYFPNLSYSMLRKSLRNKDIKLNGQRISTDSPIKSGDIVEIYINDSILFGLPKELTTIYEDENIIIAFKPQGLLSNSIESSNTEVTFEDFVKEEKGDVKICHRLDRNTSGLLIFAKNDSSYKEILQAFKNGTITKEYIAYVDGTSFQKEHEILKNYIIKNSATGFSKVVTTPVTNSQEIITEIKVLDKNTDKNFSMLSVKIHTGKTHQIRAQLSAISHPIIGDPKYGKNEINKKFKIYKQLLFAVKYSFNFESDSSLAYLNKDSYFLNDDLYINKL